MPKVRRLQRLHLHRPSLARSAALLVIAAIVPVLVFGGMAALSAYRHQQAELRDTAVADARRLSEAIDRELVADLDAAQALAALPQLDSLEDLTGFQEVARREQLRHPLWLAILLHDSQGQRMANSSASPRLGPAVDPTSIPEVVATGRPVVGAIARGERELGIPVRAPVVRAGAVIAIVTIVIRPQGLASLLSKERLPREWIAGVIDKSGRVVARNPDDPALIGRMSGDAALKARAANPYGAYEGLTFAGVPTVSAFWKSPTSGWSVHIAIPRAVFEAPLRRSLAPTVAGFLVSLLLAGLFLALLARELSLRRREAAATEQSHRMEALGRLTGGVAHDFNNLLMIIQGNADILQRRKLAEAAKGPVDAIREATRRAARLTRELLIFARGGQAETVVVDLNLTLAEFLGAVQQAVGPKVEVRTEFDPSAGAVEVDRVQLELAVLNLAVNARDAMVDGGVVTLATRRLSDALVQLAVSDTGPGIPDDIRAKVFDPFFTTKPPGSGTGLGLTQVYGFAKHSGGVVELQNRPGRGLGVVLRLPAAASEGAGAVAATAAADAGLDLAGRRILVLDDNPDVRQVLAAYLREQQVAVVEANDAAEGLTLIAGADFDAVVSDIVMPGDQSGLDLARIARSRWPDLPVVLVSGYSDGISEAGAQGFRVLRKPYEMDDLGAVLTELMPPRSASGAS